MMAEPHDSTIARWNRIQTALFPWMREELDPLTEALERLIHVLDTIRLEAFVPPRPAAGVAASPTTGVPWRGRSWQNPCSACRPPAR